MKPNIDLTSPFVQAALKLHQTQCEIALGAPQTVEKSVIPIAAVPKTKLHQKPKTKPEQIGSGVLVNIKNQYFIFSATHVFLEFGEQALITGDGNGNLLQQLTGERFSTGNPLFPKENKLDATVYHIQTKMSESLQKLAISLEDFDFHGMDNSKPVYMATGFRAKKSNVAGNSIKSKIDCFPSFEYEPKDYEKLNLSSESQIILAYENQVLVNNKWQTSPIPRGMSGGAIIKVTGTSINPTIKVDQPAKQFLTGILTEQHRDKADQLGYLVGTRINVFLGLINKFLPDLLKDF